MAFRSFQRWRKDGPAAGNAFQDDILQDGSKLD